MTDDRPQKSLYPEDDLATWIEDTADESERSESWLLQRIVGGAMKSVDGEVVDINRYEGDLKEI